MLLALVAACGGDGSVTPTTPVQIYSITSNSISQYTGGEILKYKVSGNGSFDDGSGAYVFNGSAIIYIYSDYEFNSLPQPALLEVISLESDTLNVSYNNYNFYDDEGNYRHYLTGDGKYYVNQDFPEFGSLKLPAKIELGKTWRNDPLLYIYEREAFHGDSTFTVISKETITVPFGNVETYKISYSISADAGFLLGSVYITGTIWIHPNIGIVKRVESGIYDNYFKFHFTETAVLTSINWSIE